MCNNINSICKLINYYAISNKYNILFASYFFEMC